MHSIVNNYCPVSLSNIFLRNATRDNGHALRNDDEFIIPHHRIEQFKKMPLYTLPLSWNNLNCSGQKMPESWGHHSEALGNLGSGNLEGGGIGERVEKGEVSLPATWDRGGRILSQQGGFQVSREGLERRAKGNQQGEIKSKGNAPCIL